MRKMATGERGNYGERFCVCWTDSVRTTMQEAKIVREKEKREAGGGVRPKVLPLLLPANQTNIHVHVK